MEPEEGQQEEQKAFIQIILNEELGGDPEIFSNLPIPLVLGYMAIAQQKLFAQYYGAINQLRAEQAAKKPDISIARIVPPNLR